MAAVPAGWLVPEWPVPPGVGALFTSRAGGVSQQPWDSMNCGDHVGDDPAHVARNREVLRQATAAHPVFLKQVHGREVLRLDAKAADGAVADACISTQAGLACCIMVADCLPVLLATDDGRAVAGAHAGWRGLAGSDGRGVLETVCADLKAAAAPGARLLAWLGPCIGPEAFEVGAEVKAAFEAVNPEAAGLFRALAGGKYLADLQGLARQRLFALGIESVHGNDGSERWCTVANASRFFSHRRDAGPRGNGFGTTGRMAACVWIR